MHRFDYHLHTNHSMDCKMTMDELCQAALQAGLNEICVTDHTEMGHPDPASDVRPDMNALFADVARAREKHPDLTIRVGIEIGDNPACRDGIKQWHFQYPLDFRLLSLHLIDNQDPYFPNFFEEKDQNIFYRRYVESKLESILAWQPDEYDAMAHLGYCAKFAPYPPESRALRYHHAPDTFDALFRALAEAGKPIELNASGYRKLNECIPGRELLLRFRELGGEFVTLGSDAHLPQFVGRWLDDARELAKSCGFRYALTFDRRKPIPVEL